MRDTSIEAYHEIVDSGLVGERQREVFEYLLIHPNKTDREIADELGYKDPNKTRPRRKDLYDLKIVIESDEPKRECTISGKNVYQWKINDDLEPKDIRKIKQEETVICPHCIGRGRIKK